MKDHILENLALHIAHNIKTHLELLLLQNVNLSDAFVFIKFYFLIFAFVSNAIQIENLSFKYKGQQSLIKDLTLSVGRGDRFGIFGANGTGKTTLMNLITGLLPYTQGSIKIQGQEICLHKKEISRIIGLVPQDFSFYDQLTPVENLEFFGSWYGMNKRDIRYQTKELLKIMGLDMVSHKPVKLFSGGMKRRINLAIGVMNQPQILFLDEPTVGVDVQSRNAIISFLKRINDAGTTLVYTSHQLNEAEDLCNVIALFDEGKIIAKGSLNTLLNTHQQTGLEGLFLELTGRNYRD